MIRGQSRREAALVAGGGLAMFLLFLMIRDSLIDDAYITLGYAKNLALHMHWGLIPHEISNSATSPLNVVLLAAVTAATRIAGGVHPVFALGVVSVALAMLMAWGWTRVARALRLPFAAPVVGVALVLLNPFLLSSVGLEVLLVPALLIALVAAVIEGRVGWFGVVAGLSLLARLDLIVFVVLIAAASERIRSRWVRVLATTALVAVPWFAFSWVYFGSAVTDTLLIKTSQVGLWGIWSFFTGPIMYSTGPVARPTVVALAFAPAVLGTFALVGWLMARTSVRWRPADPFPRLGPAVGLGAGGIAYYALFSLMGVGPYHWYYVPTTASLAMFLAIAVGVWLTHARERPGWRPAVPALALGLAGLLALGSAVRDVKQGVPWRTAVISTNFATASDYARVGTALRGRLAGATVLSPGEIGTLAYFCDCAIVDVFSHRGFVVQLVEDRIRNAAPVGRQLLRLNYLWLDRGEKPPQVDYRLGYASGPRSGRDVWQVWSEWKGVGHFHLIPRARPRGA